MHTRQKGLGDQMASKAYYGITIHNYNDSGIDISDLNRMLSVIIMPSPKRWNLVKYAYKLDVEHPKNVFEIIFTSIIDEEELKEFIEPFQDMKYTDAYGLEL